MVGAAAALEAVVVAAAAREGSANNTARAIGYKRAEVRVSADQSSVDIALERYLVLARAVFRFGNEAVPWQTHVFSASTSAETLSPLDTDEIAEARWGTSAELLGPIRENLLATGRALWRYRVALHDAAVGALSAEDS